jgi:RNA polymerase sigma factor (sigma-70 family)
MLGEYWRRRDAWVQALVRTPQTTLPSDDRNRVLRAVIAELPDSHRVVLEMRYFGERPLAEIAKSEGISLGTVKSRLHYALDKLRLALKAREETERLRA